MATEMRTALEEPPMDGQRQAQLIAVGLDHTTAGIELRERLAFADADVAAALRRITRPADASARAGRDLVNLQPSRALRHRAMAAFRPAARILSCRQPRCRCI